VSNFLLKELRRSKYRLLGLVGQGQFGRVYCASRRKTGRLFALKELDKQRFPTHMFLRELRFLLSLQHPHIVTCHALEHTQTGRYLVMDYCEGGTLRNLMTEDNRLHPDQCLKLVAEVLAGLDHAHARDIVHCDVKPENILLTLDADGWTARISDFGIARLRQELPKAGAGNTGSPAYMSPERFYGQYSHSSDLYAVGILLFELLMGYRPFSGSPADLMSAHLNRSVIIPAAVPKELQDIIVKALQKLPARRFRSAAEMLTAVQAAASHLRSTADGRWGSRSLLQPINPLSTCDCLALRQDPLKVAVQQLLVTSLPGRPAGQSARPDQDAYGGGEGDRPTDATYQLQARGSQIGYQIYRQGILSGDRRPDQTVSQLASQSLPMTLINLPETVRELMVRPQGCFAVTERSVYFIPLRLDAETAGIPQRVVTFDQSVMVAIAPQGGWMATAISPSDAENTVLTVWHLPKANVTKQTVLARVTACIVHPRSRRFQLMALDSRHIAIFSHRLASPTGVSSTGLQLEILSRRGNLLGSFNFPLHLCSVISSTIPYHLLAMEQGHPQTLLFIDLKPLKMTRIGVTIAPIFFAATAWGYVLMAADGQIALLNHYGQRIGQIDGPANPTAIATVEPYGLLIATWDGEQGCLYTIDLSQLELDVVF